MHFALAKQVSPKSTYVFYQNKSTYVTQAIDIGIDNAYDIGVN